MKTENKELINKIFSDSKFVDYAHFINSCLYDKQFGYYNNSSISRDFVTSPITHESFGKIFCKQLQEVWDYYQKPRQFVIVEVGGNEGKLKKDIFFLHLKEMIQMEICLLRMQLKMDQK